MVPVTKHIIFDLDGTLTDQSRIFRAQAEAVAGAFGAGFDRYQPIIDAFYAAHDDAVANHPEHRGDIPWYMQHMTRTLDTTITDEEAAALAIEWKTAHEQAMADQQLYPDVVENLERLKATGCVLYLASGSTKENRLAILKNLGIADYFTEVFAAGTIGHQKQQRAFWDTVLQALDVPAASLTMVGNQLNDDILHPQALGMKTVFIERPGDLARAETLTTVTPAHKIATLAELQYEQ
ncbi:MAG: HAD family hydrolase [Candidatus Pacebacteria bacterium]|nr:HAD family hydrolase [Candidatus Paceibacterota bacterium]